MGSIVSPSRQRYIWAGLICGFVFIHGAIMQVRGPLLPLIQSNFSVSESILGLVGPTATAGTLVALLVGGLRAGSVDMKRLMAVATAAAAVVTAGLAYAPTIGIMLALFGLQGLSFGLFRAFDRPILGHMFPESRSRVFSYYAAVWAVGAATGPLLTNIVISHAAWQSIFLLFVPALLGFMILCFRLDEPPGLSVEQSLHRAELSQLLRHPGVLSIALLVMLSGGVEGVIYAWYPYFSQRFTSVETANTLLSLYLIAYIPGRVVVGTLIEYVENLRFVLVLSVLALPALYLAIQRPELAYVGIPMSGLLISGFFPALLAHGVDQAPEFSGPINSATTAASMGGVTISPIIVGVLASLYGIATAILTIFVLTGLLALGCGVTIAVVE